MDFLELSPVLSVTAHSDAELARGYYMGTAKTTRQILEEMTDVHGPSGS